MMLRLVMFNYSTAAKPAMTPECHAVALFRRVAAWSRWALYRS